MLSEGRPGIDDRYSLQDGKLVVKSDPFQKSAWMA